MLKKIIVSSLLGFILNFNLFATNLQTTILQTNASDSPLIFSETSFPSIIPQTSSTSNITIDVSSIVEFIYQRDKLTDIYLLDGDTIDETPHIIGAALPYPNPMKFSNKTGIIAYKLSGHMDIELRVYNMGANLIYKTNFVKGSQGGMGGIGTYNEVPFTPNQVGQNLPVGIYIFILINDKKVIAKGKIAVVG